MVLNTFLHDRFDYQYLCAPRNIFLVEERLIGIVAGNAPKISLLLRKVSLWEVMQTMIYV